MAQKELRPNDKTRNQEDVQKGMGRLIAFDYVIQGPVSKVPEGNEDDEGKKDV